MIGDTPPCPVCSGRPMVVVAVAHATLRNLTVELLDREHGCWRARAVADLSELAATLDAAAPDLVIVDTADFARCCRDLLGTFPRERVVVVGPEPDPAYEHAARRGGAGAWLSSDRVAEDLSACMRTVLGCTHGPCPPQPADTPTRGPDVTLTETTTRDA